MNYLNEFATNLLPIAFQQHKNHIVHNVFLIESASTHTNIRMLVYIIYVRHSCRFPKLPLWLLAHKPCVVILLENLKDTMLATILSIP
jgi:hypothetical protein